jgi:hypothetical protein
MVYRSIICRSFFLFSILFTAQTLATSAFGAQFLGGPSVRVNPNTSVEFKWMTDVAWFGKVEIFSSPDGTPATLVATKKSEDEAGNPLALTQQTVTMNVASVITPDTTFYFRVTAWDPTGSNGDLIVPAPLPPFFTGAQAVSNVQADLITTTTVTISWQANVIGLGSVAFGITTLDQSVQDLNNTTDHSIQVTGLTPDTTYQFRVSNLHVIDGDALASTTIQLTTARATKGGPDQHRTADLVGVGYRLGSPQLDVNISVPNSVDSEARKAGKDFAVCVSVNYTSQNQTFETVRSGRLSISSLLTQSGPLQNILKGRSLELVEIPFGATPPPGGSPGYSVNAVILDPSELTCP